MPAQLNEIRVQVRPAGALTRLCYLPLPGLPVRRQLETGLLCCFELFLATLNGSLPFSIRVSMELALGLKPADAGNIYKSAG